jgi:hypothetical protein
MSRTASVWVLILGFICLALPANAQNAGSTAKQQTLAAPELLGFQLSQAYGSLGAPDHVYSVRGAQPWKDDVVFFYPSHLYLYWYHDRVWQVRFDKDYDGTFLSLTMGLTREQVRSVLGKPLHIDTDWDLFQLQNGSPGNPDRGYPVRVRLFFSADRLSDAYIYRGDF